MGLAAGVSDWIFPMETFRKLLFFSLVMHLVVIAGGTYYMYKTRHIIRRWVAYHIGLGAHKRHAEPHYPFYKLRLSVFHMLQEEAHPQKAILFVGDSLTNAFEWQEFFQNNDHPLLLNRGLTGARVELLIDKFEMIFLSGYDVQKIFIMVGINDIRQETFSMEKFSSDYNVLLDKLLTYFEGRKICLQSILPVRTTGILTRVIKGANAQIRTLALSKGIDYIDLFDILLDENGLLHEKYATDGVHLSVQGYRLWIEHLRPYLANIPGNEHKLRNKAAEPRAY
jgi:lysophospholipase L1-like esterase